MSTLFAGYFGYKDPIFRTIKGFLAIFGQKKHHPFVDLFIADLLFRSLSPIENLNRNWELAGANAPASSQFRRVTTNGKLCLDDPLADGGPSKRGLLHSSLLEYGKLCLDDPLADGVFDQLRARVQVELVHDVFPVAGNRLRADAQDIPDLRVALALRQVGQHLLLARG